VYLLNQAIILIFWDLREGRKIIRIEMGIDMGIFRISRYELMISCMESLWDPAGKGLNRKVLKSDNLREYCPIIFRGDDDCYGVGRVS